MPIVFACISPHPPIILPSVIELPKEAKMKKRFISSTGSKEDQEKVKNTIEALEGLGKKLKELKPDSIIISSPHPNWGFEVPLFFLAKDFKGEIKTYLMGMKSPEFYFNEGKILRQKLGRDPLSNCSNRRIGLIASGDLSHYLKEDGPYGFHPDGPKFDKTLIDSLKKKDIKTILKLDEMFPEAGECGLRSICFMLGILETSGINYQPEVLSYEGPFGVGYLVANFKLIK